MPDPLLLFNANDMVLELRNLRDKLVNPNNDPAGTFLNAATVTIIALVDEEGTDVSGPTLPLTMDYVGGSIGIYRATLADTWGFIIGQCHAATVRADAGAGLRAEWVLQIESQTREE